MAGREAGELIQAGPCVTPDGGVTFWHLIVTMALARRVNHGAADSAGAEAGRAAPRMAFGGVVSPISSNVYLHRLDTSHGLDLVNETGTSPMRHVRMPEHLEGRP